ncbi:tRNA(Ile)-lysidine synthase [Sinosporangium album]|uniref:tRNA(Ile)-lysidine synthase n=1 Tax=Sinosporangium album TaxID=504805 RepID=A0A1G8FDB4_9ACTN|nr:tRNA lysidine(34) synthetase TilS [Sinosporangium album]SDH80120.1 tRNA(Ile)-lysidine synthase [Sinosporangium album]
MGPHPAVADVRRAVRESLADLTRGGLVLVACSGGADSLALAAGLGFAAPRMGLRAGLVTVDHGLQEGSARQADRVVRLAPSLGLDPAEVLAVTVGTEGGPEAAAREARYAALAGAAERLGAEAVLLGHTRDDQAETVLLGLVRGSGPRSLAGMAGIVGIYRRPLLGLGRSVTTVACAALGLAPWEDPHNRETRYTRVRVREHVLPVLCEELGPGIPEALARTAALCRDDADALDAWADRVYREALTGRPPAEEASPPARPAVCLSVSVLASCPAAVRRRVIRRAALAAGSPSGALAAVHIAEADRLVTEWRGQRAVHMPGGVGVVRNAGVLAFERMCWGSPAKESRAQG